MGEEDTFDVYIHNLGSGTTVNATGTHGEFRQNFVPTFSSDGAWVTFISNRDGPGQWELYGLPMAGDVVATADTLGSPALTGMANTELQWAAERHGLKFIAEAFVDRAYEPDGTLVSRAEPGAVHSEISTVTTQAVGLALEGRVTARNGEVIHVQANTLCIHGDTPGAAEAARAVRDVLESHGIEIRAS